MAKRRRTTQRSHTAKSVDRPGFSRRQLPPPSSRGPSRTWLFLVGAVVLVLVVGGAAWWLGLFGGGPAGPSPSPTPTIDTSRLHPPSATPLPSAPAEPAGDGTTATIVTELGTIVIDLYTESAPVAAENFINLAEAGYYNGIGFHRIIPDFMIQGGDPEGTGAGGPGYTIVDEPFAGTYDRGIVAMARTSQPNSQGSQFFIMVADTPELEGRGYTIFGKVQSGMDVVDEIVAGETTGPQNDQAVDPVIMDLVTIQRPAGV